MVRRFFMLQLHPSYSCLSWGLSLRNELTDNNALWTFSALLPVIRPSSQSSSLFYTITPHSQYSFQVWHVSKVFPHYCYLPPWLILLGSIPSSLWGPDMEHPKQVEIHELKIEMKRPLWLLMAILIKAKIKLSWETFPLLLLEKHRNKCVNIISLFEILILHEHAISMHMLVPTT